MSCLIDDLNLAAEMLRSGHDVIRFKKGQVPDHLFHWFAMLAAWDFLEWSRRNNLYVSPAASDALYVKDQWIRGRVNFDTYKTASDKIKLLRARRPVRNEWEGWVPTVTIAACACDTSAEFAMSSTVGSASFMKAEHDYDWSRHMEYPLNHDLIQMEFTVELFHTFANAIDMYIGWLKTLATVLSLRVRDLSIDAEILQRVIDEMEDPLFD